MQTSNGLIGLIFGQLTKIISVLMETSKLLFKFS
jgi:hypothetical protein